LRADPTDIKYVVSKMNKNLGAIGHPLPLTIRRLDIPHNLFYMHHLFICDVSIHHLRWMSGVQRPCFLCCVEFQISGQGYHDDSKSIFHTHHRIQSCRIVLIKVDTSILSWREQVGLDHQSHHIWIVTLFILTGVRGLSSRVGTLEILVQISYPSTILPMAK